MTVQEPLRLVRRADRQGNFVDQATSVIFHLLQTMKQCLDCRAENNRIRGLWFSL